MKEIILNKLTIIFMAFGAIFTLLLGLFAGIPVITLIFRAFLSLVIMGALGIGINLIVKKFLPEEEVKKLFSKESYATEKEESGQNINMVDDSGISPEELYSENSDTPSEEAAGNNRGNSGFSINLKSDDVPTPMGEGTEKEEFKPMDFNDAPRVKQVDDTEIQIDNSSVSAEDQTEDNDDMIKNAFNQIKERSSQESMDNQRKQTSTLDKGHDVTFKVKNKKMTADPSLVAKAIRTIMNRE